MVGIKKMEPQTGKKRQMDIFYVNAPVQYVVEEKFEGNLTSHDDLSLRQILLDQETVYESLRKDAQSDTVESSPTTAMENHNNRFKRDDSSQNVNANSQLAMDEAYARELQELENQLSYSYLNRTSETDVSRPQSSMPSSEGTFVNNATIQADEQDGVDPDNMTYEELQSLGEAIGTENKGLSDELISYLPTSTYKSGLFSRREKNEECVICYMAYKNRDKLITLPCQHQYHKGCVSHWLKINKACPICNEEVFGS